MREIEISVTLNGETQKTRAYPFSRLLDVLRENFLLTGTKEGCGEGECGACSVFVNGKLVNSCLIPVAQVQNQDVVTIEGVSKKSETNAIELHEVQKAFLSGGGAQCGICTPGMIMATLDLLKRNPRPSLHEIREGLAGNLCRCTGYMKIFETIQSLQEKIRS